MKKSFRCFLIVMAVMTLVCCSMCEVKKVSSENEITEKKASDKESKKAKKRSESLDALYLNTTLGETTLTFTEAKWNELLANTNSNDKTKYSACDWTYSKGGQKYTMTNIGIKNRGNTSFRAPEKTSTHTADGTKYQQAHFKLKFTKYEDDDAHHLEKAAKAMNLKYMLSDSSYVQEMYSYDLFKRFGVWTAPRCSYTKLYITVGSTPKAYFGMYKTVETIDKQYIKARVGDGMFSSDKGNLWKCLYQYDGPADMQRTDDNLFGVDTKEKTPVYSLKTNEDTGFDAAKTQFKSFISNLNSKSGSEFETWIKSAFDVDGFLKALAVDVACGMWDDIWRNFNNYYMYFDEGGKAYFIPYDYDNSVGQPNDGLMPHPAEKNPLEWGQDSSVLPYKILSNATFLATYKKYLSDLANDSKNLLCKSASVSRINAWYTLIEPYCDKNTYDADYHASKDGHSDWSLNKGVPSILYTLTGNTNNYFELRCKAFKDAVGDSSSGSTDPGSQDVTGKLDYAIDGENITFTFDPTWYGLTASEISEPVYVRGGFNGWSGDSVNDYQMTKNGSVWTLTCIKPSNNSEYKFTYGTDGDCGTWLGAKNRVSAYQLPSDYTVGDDGNIVIKY